MQAICIKFRVLKKRSTDIHLLVSSTVAAMQAKERIEPISVTVMAAGDGIHFPQHAQLVSIHYSAFLADGTLWDSTHKRQKPLRFRLGLGQVIQGLDDGVMQLSLSEKARFHIPAGRAYGQRGFPGLVPPDSALVFDVELTEIV